MLETITTGIYGGVNHRCVTVELLTGETILISTEGKTTCSAIWNRVEGELVARGVVHPQIFGLAIKAGSHQWVFVDPEAKVSKYFPKECKSTSQNNPGSISYNKTPILYCRVNFYLDALPQTFDVVSLHHYYLQLRSNLVSAPRYPSENITQPIAFAYQAELGDWRICQETPLWAQHLGPNLGPALTRAHQALSGMGQQAARIAFIRSVMPQYNMHLYTMKTKDGNAPVWIGVTPKGVEVYQGYCQNGIGCTEIPEHPKVTFLWAHIEKLYFERKKFEIIGRAWSGSLQKIQKLSFLAASEAVPKHLLILCRKTHQFLPAQRLLLTSDNKGGSTGGESSCSSSSTLHGSSSSSSKNDEKMLDLSLWATPGMGWDGLLLAGGGESSEHQRVSVISNASSNTTSGIVSDRVYSLDGSEEDLDLREIPYCCTERPTNNSTSLESLSQKHPMTEEDHNNDNTEVTDSDAKFWYCDSDCECEDCDLDRDCQTIDETRECNSCEDELDGLSLSSPSKVIHHNSTPSMVSEGTLKAVDIYCAEEEREGGDNVSSSSVTDKVKLQSGTTKTTETRTDSKTPTPMSSKVSSSSLIPAIETTSTPSQQYQAPKKTNNNNNNSNKVTEKTADYVTEKVEKVDSVTNCDSKEKDSIQKSKERLEEQQQQQQKKLLDYDNGKEKMQEQENDDDDHDDPTEHVYGEICEDPDNKTDDEQEYFTIDNNKGNNKRTTTATNTNKVVTSTTNNTTTAVKKGENENNSIIGIRKQRHCVKSNNMDQIKTRCKGKLLKELKSSSRRITNNSSSIGGCVSGGKCENKCNSTNTATTTTAHAHATCGKECNKKNFSTNVLGTKENGLTPKIASLKCLKSTQKGLSSLTCSSSSSWLPGGVSKKNALNNKKNYTNGLSSQQNDYVEFGEKLQQGRYPSTRTVSDNFETDSDYVQLPPLFPKPLLKKPTSKLWKLVTKTTSSNNNKNSLVCRNNSTNSNSNSSPVSSPSESTTPSPTPGPAVNLHTLPRRHKLEHSRSISNEPSKVSNMNKVSSKSTTALNISSSKPEPPPKPIKRHVSTSLASTKPVDARFIATKPQILVQTAYATAVAPVGIPSQSQVLLRTSKIPSNVTTTAATTNNNINSNSSSKNNTLSAQNLFTTNNYQSMTTLQHSQRSQSLSVDNIYDTVASEMPMTIPSSTPPPYPTNTKGGGKSIIIKPNNYIDVHASAIKNRKVSHSKPKSFAQVNGGSSQAVHHNNHHHRHHHTTTPNGQIENNLLNPPTNGCAIPPSHHNPTTTSCSGNFNMNGGKNIANRCGSVPNNLNNFFIGLQNLKPLSRAPIIHPTATSSMSLSSNNNHNNSAMHNNINSNNNNNNNVHVNGMSGSNNVGCLHTSSSVNLMRNTSTSFNYNVPCPHACGTVIGSQSTSNVNQATTAATNNSNNHNMNTSNNSNNTRGLSSSTSLVNNCNGSCSAAAAATTANGRFTTIYSQQLARSQIQQFKAQLYSDMDYVVFPPVFPPRDPRIPKNEQEYYDSKSLSYTTLSSTNSAAYGINDIPPPYLPPPPPYPSSGNLSSTSLTGATGGVTMGNSHQSHSNYQSQNQISINNNSSSNHSHNNNNNSDNKPPRPAKTIGIGSIPAATAAAMIGGSGGNVPMGFTGGSNHSVTASCSATSPSSYHNSYGSLYNIGSNNSQCSSSQYATGGYYAAVGSLNLNAENIQRFLSIQSLASSNISSAPIYYPCSTQSAPLPPSSKNNNNDSKNIIIENEMRKTLQNQIMHMNSRLNGGGGGQSATMSEERMRMKLCRSEESLYTTSQPITQTEEKLQAMYNLRPPPPYHNGTKVSPSELDLASLNEKASALDLPLLRALLREQKKISESDGSLPQSKIRPTAHSHPKKLSLPPKPIPPTPTDKKISSDRPPPLPPHNPQKPRV